MFDMYGIHRRFAVFGQFVRLIHAFEETSLATPGRGLGLEQIVLEHDCYFYCFGPSK